jgi:hypothetical protein
VTNQVPRGPAACFALIVCATWDLGFGVRRGDWRQPRLKEIEHTNVRRSGENRVSIYAFLS